MSKPMASSEILEKLNWRYAVQKFDTKRKIPSEDWKILAESLRLAPSSYGLQPWKFLVVENPNLRKELLALSWNQNQVVDCSHFVVFATLTNLTEEYLDKYLSRVSEVRDVPVQNLERFRNIIVNDAIKGPRASQVTTWNHRQAYIAMGMLMQTAALMNIDTCPMEGLSPGGYDKVLGLQGSQYGVVAAVACGYRSSEDRNQTLKKVRFPMEEVIQYL